MPAARSACRCCDVFAVDCPLARASSSTERGACASRSRSSSRTGLANALPISAIASKSAALDSRSLIPCYSMELLRACQAGGLRRDVSRLPPELRDELYDRLVGQPYEQILDWLQSRSRDAVERPDLPALALVMVESISAYHSLRRTFGRTPDSVDDERYIAAWTETARAVARGYGIHDRD